MATATLLPSPADCQSAPVRPGGSVRRTCTIDVSWPEGDMADRLFIGRVRDFHTPSSGGSGTVVDQPNSAPPLRRTRPLLQSRRPRAGKIDQLVGVRGGNHLRLFIKETNARADREGMPIYLALDDISGTSLVSAFAWSQCTTTGPSACASGWRPANSIA